MATIIRVNGQKTEISPINGKTYSLKELKDAIGGGYIEIVSLPETGELLVCDEDGKRKGMEINPEATAYVLLNGLLDAIVGQVLICKAGEIE